MLHNINVGVFNSRSLCNKTAGVFEYLSDHGIDVCFLTETWLRKGDTSKVTEIKELGYNIAHQSRQGKGGGVAIASKRHIEITRRNSTPYKSFEHLECTIKSATNELLRLVCVYRSCNSKYSNIADFCTEFDEYIEGLMHLPGKLLIAGDFNIHVEDNTDADFKRFSNILILHGLVQHVESATHIGGGTLDLILTRENIQDSIPVNDIKYEKTLTTFGSSFCKLQLLLQSSKWSTKSDKNGQENQEH